jgi:EAL domain-containing protein (putative c-di-GMP-specific phosphodiesterase class I)
MELETDLHKALANNEFYLTYQPQIDTRTMETIGYEALLRWHNPLRGMVPPGRFIPLAEETGQILEIDNWVLRTACQQNQEWKRKGYMPLKVSVNISMYHFKQKDIVKNISAVLKRTGLTPRLLELEVTERVTTDIEHAFSIFHELKQLGVSISIDDFGIGYSSLNYLKKLPIDKIKIDSSFVKGMLECKKDTAIVSSIITLAHNLELQVIAEGVEDGQQLSLLKKLGCDQIQGYLISKPIVSNNFQKKFLKKPS